MEVLETSRSTLYRDLRYLIELGVPIETLRINGEARKRLASDVLPHLRPSLRECIALRLSRDLLVPLEGTSVVSELDRFLDKVSSTQGHVTVSATASGKSPSHAIAEIDNALNKGRLLRIRYQGTYDLEPRERIVDPVELRLRGQHLYLVGFDCDENDWRVFKATRVVSAECLLEEGTHASEYNADKLFGHSAGIWAGATFQVRICLAPSVARLVEEWPLVADQNLAKQADGSVVVSATVSGLEETKRWCLSWGRNAQALAPIELREALLDELSAAHAAYLDGLSHDN